ncbi:uracil permease [Desulfuribacillus stibiiarsenatis]|uniref:Uracil permease n=1 Tax=Desulfuribacillus stibiiarsenatis TaxID=1390249 RepID=A0A1E5L2D2_9FIRM|nr:nucleobase:cation symporter-2 family protein [Desulfuribacillus stibiiarsenatis]OEH84266.1 uracil permease [Desulfuribacillus stibiiarsenatis]
MGEKLNEEKLNTSPYELDGKPPLKEAIPLGIQHVLAMFVGNVTVPIIVAGAIGLTVEDRAFLIQCAMLIAGVATLLQVYRIGPVGARLPIVMGTSFGFVPIAISVGNTYGLSAVFGAALIGGLFEMVLGSFLKPLRKLFPPVVTGTVLLTIGLYLIPTGMNYVAGGVGKPDFGSFSNLFLAGLVFVTILIFNQYTKGMFKVASILIGMVVGYIVAIPMGKVNFDAVVNAPWFSIPMPLEYGITFVWPAIFAMCLMYVVTAIETVGDISGITVGGAKREATDEELRGGIMADGLGSVLAALFNAFPNTSFSQNVGIVSLTGIMSRFVVLIGAVFLILAGLFPKLGAIIAVMPTSVLGGAAIIMFAMIMTSGIAMVSRDLSQRNLLILACSLGIGLGVGNVPGVLGAFSETTKLILGGSGGMVIAAFLAVILNVVLPKGTADSKPICVSEETKIEA